MFDNMDLTVGGIMHHITLPFFEFETENTSNLSTDSSAFWPVSNQELRTEVQ